MPRARAHSHPGVPALAVHDFDGLESAQAFAANPLLELAMKDLGVAGPPSGWLARAVD